MTGAERTFANAYRPDDVIRYNRNSKVYKVKAGDYAKVIDTNHEKNEITVRFADGRTATYNPTRLSGVNVYTEAERLFAEGDRIQFRAPFAEQRVANGELGTITKIEQNQIHVALDDERRISFDPQQFPAYRSRLRRHQPHVSGTNRRSRVAQCRYTGIISPTQRPHGLCCAFQSKRRGADLYRLGSESARDSESRSR